MTAKSFGEVDADDFVVVAGVEGVVGVGGVGPEDVTAGGGAGGFEDVGAADFFVTFGTKFRDDEVAFFVEEEKAVGVFDEEGVGPAHFFFVVGGGFEGFPNAVAGVGFEAAELAIATDAVDVAVFEKRGDHGGVEGVGIFLADFFALPDEGGGGFVVVEAEGHGTVVEAGEEEEVVHLARGGDGHGEFDVDGVRPIDFAGFGIERVDGFGMPDDELTFAATLNDGGRAVAGFLGGKGVPDFLAGIFVEGDGGGVGAADEADEFIAIEQRAGGEAPHGRGNIIVLFEFVGPDGFAVFGVEAEEMAFGTERVHFAIADERGGAWAGGIADGVGRVVFVLPENFAGGFIEAKDAFGAGDDAALERVAGIVRAFVELTVNDVNAAFGNGGPGIARADGCAPADGCAVGGEFLDDAGFAPDAVALRAEPLRPITGEEWQRKSE
ncbi:MAG: hypothetical protein JWQ71_2213 [Pedosphaera sp.]|nr:hypothetical protein [Pedosphaera sp.]